MPVEIKRLSVVAAATVGALGCGSLTLAGSAVAALPPGCSAVSGTVTCTFSFTGAAQSFVVPAGVDSVAVAAVGAQGGGDSGAIGGLGGEASGIGRVAGGGGRGAGRRPRGLRAAGRGDGLFWWL